MMKQGDKCKVRMLATGEVVEAVYHGRSHFTRKCHFLRAGKKKLIAINYILYMVPYGDNECRFIGNPGVRE